MTFQPQMTRDEKSTGHLAQFIVYYRKAGKVVYQAVYATNLRKGQNAGDFVKDAVRGATILRVLDRQPGAEVR